MAKGPSMGKSGDSDQPWGLRPGRDKDQQQDREYQHAETQEYDFAHYIGLQQVVTTHKSTAKKD